MSKSLDAAVAGPAINEVFCDALERELMSECAGTTDHQDTFLSAPSRKPQALASADYQDTFLSAPSRKPQALASADYQDTFLSAPSRKPQALASAVA